MQALKVALVALKVVAWIWAIIFGLSAVSKPVQILIEGGSLENAIITSMISGGLAAPAVLVLLWTKKRKPQETPTLPQVEGPVDDRNRGGRRLDSPELEGED